MALDTKANLKQAISDWLNRGSELDDRIDDFIALAEARHRREIRIREMRVRDPLFVDDRFVLFPEGLLDFAYLRLNVPNAQSGRKFFPDISEVSVDQLTRRSYADNDKRRPSAFAVHDQFEFDAVPDQTYDGELLYFTSLPRLDNADNPTNALLDRAPDAYLYASLVASAPFLLHDERIQVWDGLYSRVREELLNSERDSRHGGPLVARVFGAMP